MDVVVIGGGIVGLSSAYHLARRGATVTVCEKGSLGGGSTGRAAGGIRTQFSTRVNVELTMASLETWDSFEEEFGVDISRRRNGYLFLAREADTAATFEANAAMQNDCGGATEVLTPAEARAYSPGIRADAFVAATYSPLDSVADPHSAVQGFAAAVTDAGVDVRTNTAVTDVHRDGRGGVSGVTAGGDRLDADFVVNAAGPWAHQIAELAGVDLPLASKRRQALVVEPERPVPEDDPLVIDLDAGVYFRPEREGTALVGGHFADTDPDQDPDAFDQGIDFDWTATAIERAADCADYFGPDARAHDGWAGLYSLTPDHHPIIEETVPGLVNAVGFSGHGFQHAPATGELVAELVFDGHASLIDIDALRSARFETGDLVDEQNVV